jgi:hypothetical protein
MPLLRSPARLADGFGEKESAYLLPRKENSPQTVGPPLPGQNRGFGALLYGTVNPLRSFINRNAFAPNRLRFTTRRARNSRYSRRCNRIVTKAPATRAEPPSRASKTGVSESPPFEACPPVAGTAAGVAVATAAVPAGVGLALAVAASVGDALGVGLGLAVGEGVGVATWPSASSPGTGEAIRTADTSAATTASGRPA